MGDQTTRERGEVVDETTNRMKKAFPGRDAVMAQGHLKMVFGSDKAPSGALLFYP